MTGIERLKKMVEGQEDAALNQVVNYLISRKDLDSKFLNEEKDLEGMRQYIRGKSMPHMKNGWNFLNDNVVYAWAITYFLLPNKQLGITKKEEKSKEKATDKVIDISNSESKNEDKNNIKQITLFGGEE